MNRRPLGLVAAAYATAVLWATIGPAPWRTSGHQLDGGILNPAAWTAPVTWTTGYLAEIAFNVAIFVPVGMLAALLISRRRWPLAMLAGFGFTAVIELVQVPEPERISDPRDLVMNTAGAVLGVVIVMVARGVRRAGLVAESLRESRLAPVTDAEFDPMHEPAPTPTPTHEPALAAARPDRAA
ncbi:VanZ family protein [Agromyces badenianii]|uniref:VanZ family protein n=1 Tax=Agromyces badenianii TaxID=2080742 RepID=UPI000D5A06ED|nr:VanZ family protein [Agromyces badenianii]PWC05206.1 VanZ family protein [Agromyces badenianii]